MPLLTCFFQTQVGPIWRLRYGLVNKPRVPFWCPGALQRTPPENQESTLGGLRVGSFAKAGRVVRI